MYSRAVSARDQTRVAYLWRLAAAVLLLVFGTTFAAPFATAQAAPVDACCRSMRGCSYRMHHAMQADGSQHGDSFAAVQERCPCTPLAQAGVSVPVATPPGATQYGAAPGIQQAASARQTLIQSWLLDGSCCTRGPPPSPDPA